MSIFSDAAKVAANATTSTSRVISSANQVSVGLNSLDRSAASIRNSAFTGVTNVGTGVINSLPGVAVGVGSAAAAVGALGALTGNSKLANAAGKIAVGATAALGAIAAVGALTKTAGAIIDLFSGAPTGAGGALAKFGSNPKVNPLHQYASYNYLFGLYALSDSEVNGGSRGGGICIIQEPNGPSIGATSYIDNVKIQGTVGLDKNTGNSNALSISFKVIEPYSMGKFWETLQTAALQSGHKNYVDAPYLLKLEFKGHFDADQPFQSIPNTSKFIHMKIREVGMRVTLKGAEYDIEAYPWNEQGMSSSFAELKTDANISCNDGGPYTVKELLKKADKSLKEIINKKLKDDKDRKKTVTYAHEIDIVFPPSPYTDNTDGNLIGESPLGLDQFNKADSAFAKDGATYDSATGIYTRGNIKINTKNADFKFAQGATVQDIINQVVLTSEYGRKALEEANQTSDGKVVWWRIETHLHNISTEDPSTGQKAKKVIFRVVPYEVDASIFLPPNTKSKAAESTIHREYNYIYTGQNHDILDFNIEYKVGFYRAFNADGGRNTEQNQLAAASGQAAPTESGGSPPDKQPAGGTGVEAVRRDKTGSSTSKNGGAGFDDAATIAARQFHDLATQGYDMQNLDITILGDPYFMGDSGHGNFTIPGEKGINAEGSMSWQSGEVYVKITFRTPEDANTDTGFYDFGNTKTVREFSGIFRVMTVENTFNRGKFTQRLSLVKMPGQNPEAPPGNYPDKNPMPQDAPDP